MKLLQYSQIDFILMRRDDRYTCLEYKVISGECVVTQHMLVVADFHFWIHFQWSKRVKMSRTKWWKLKEYATRTFKDKVLNEGRSHEGGDANSMWMCFVCTATRLQEIGSRSSLANPGWRFCGAWQLWSGMSSTDDRWPGNRPDMTPKTLQIQRLTLVPTQSPEISNGNKEEDEAAKILDQEWMARAVEITATTGASWWRWDSVHGVEPES
jgi:hypothetical protein